MRTGGYLLQVPVVCFNEGNPFFRYVGVLVFSIEVNRTAIMTIIHHSLPNRILRIGYIIFLCIGYIIFHIDITTIISHIIFNCIG